MLSEDPFPTAKSGFPWLRFVGLVGGIALIVLLIQRADPASIITGLRGFPLGILLAVLALYVLNLATKAIRWHVLLGSIGRRLGLRGTWRAYVISLAINNATPGRVVGDPVRIMSVARRAQVRNSRVVGIVVAEKTLDLLAVAGIAGAGLIMLPWLFGAGEVLLLLGVLLLVGSGAVFLWFLVRWTDPARVGDSGMIRSLLTIPFRRFPMIAAKLTDWLIQIMGSLRSLRTRPATLLVSSLLTMMIWGNETLRLFLILRGLGIDVELGLLILITGIATLVGTVLPLGSGNFASISALAVRSGIPLSATTTAAFLMMATSLWLLVPPGVLLILLRRSGVHAGGSAPGAAPGRAGSTTASSASKTRRTRQ